MDNCGCPECGQTFLFNRKLRYKAGDRIEIDPEKYDHKDQISDSKLYRAYDTNFRPISCTNCDNEKIVILPREFKGFGTVGKFSAMNKANQRDALKERARKHSQKQLSGGGAAEQVNKQIAPVIKNMENNGI
jgi:hypothetical protein